MWKRARSAHNRPAPPSRPHTPQPTQRYPLMKRPLLVLAIPLLAAGGAWYALSPAAAQDAAPVADGKAAYEGNCAACHQPNGQGLAGAFPPLAGSDWLHGKTPA